MLQCLRCPCYLFLLSLIPCLPRMDFLYLIYSLIYVKCYICLFFFWWPHPPDASHGHVRCFPFIVLSHLHTLLSLYTRFVISTVLLPHTSGCRNCRRHQDNSGCKASLGTVRQRSYACFSPLTYRTRFYDSMSNSKSSHSRSRDICDGCTLVVMILGPQVVGR